MSAARDLRKLEIVAMLVDLKRWSNTVRALRGLSALLLTTLLIPACNLNAYGQISAAGEANQTQLHGGIQIDPEGIKVAVIRLSDTPQRSGAEVVFTEEFNVTLGREQDGKFKQDVVKTVGRAAKDYYTLIRQQYQVLPQHIHVIGSSDLDAGNQEELATEIKNNIGASITFLDLKSEAQLSVIGTVPRRYREGGTWFDNRSQSAVIDVGSYKTKGGYQQLRQPLVGDPYYEFVAVGISLGTTSFTDEVNQAVGEDAGINKFALNARTLSESSIKSALRNELKKRPGLAYRKKIYLNGAIVGAMMTLLRPEDRQQIIPITVDDINIFYQQAVASPQVLLNPSLSRIRNDGVRKEVERELETVKSTFTPKSLIAGAAILKAIASECNFQEEGKRILYARFSNMGSILSYLLLQAGEGPQP
ncbi:MAG TPA: hypothetical protein VJ810_41930 [Blastocatellia bacterium]|nr:hypothetical protein [Blastocatellia bacterium]